MEKLKIGRNKIALLVLVTILFLSCSTNEPATYKTWKCIETSQLGTHSFLVDVYHSRQDTTIYLFSNFHNITTDDTGDIRIKKSGTKLTVEASQSIALTTYIIRSGSGTINANSTEMILDYLIYDGKSEFQVHATFSR